MSGLVGSWSRIHDDRKSRAERSEAWRGRRSMKESLDRMTGVTWLAQITIPKRWCRVHVVNDRCWRKPKEGK